MRAIGFVAHPDATLYRQWVKDLRERVSLRTADQYASDVARFLRDHPRLPIRRMGQSVIRRYRRSLTPGASARMMSAVGRFFQYALEQRAVDYDPVFDTKYHRSGSSDLQPDLLELMIEGGMTEQQARSLRWGAVLEALTQPIRQRRLGFRGSTIRMPQHSWYQLERAFRMRVRTHRNLAALLRTRVAG